MLNGDSNEMASKSIDLISIKHLAGHSLLANRISHFLTATIKFSCSSSNQIRLHCFQLLAIALSPQVSTKFECRHQK